jgi:RNA polymerase sigma-70 factor (ECF subfamily)
MGRALDSETSLILLVRLQQDATNQHVWAEFVEYYRPKLYGWCLGWGLQDADAQDVTQNVMLRLVEKVRDFRYDPRGNFLAWLKTLARHAVSDLCQTGRRAGRGSGGGLADWLLESVAAREDQVQRLDEEFDWELLEEAMQRIRLRVAPQTWQAFCLTALKRLSGAEAAARIPMQVAQVFVAKRRVLRMLRDEVARLGLADTLPRVPLQRIP